MLSTAVQAFFGFFFWVINARLFTTEEVGIATTLISVMALIGTFSSFGLNIGLIRFLPSTKKRNELITASFIISTLTSSIFVAIFIFGLPILSPKLEFLRHNLFYIFTFALFIILFACNIIIESIFTSKRASQFTLIKNTILSVIKVLMPIPLALFGSYGIFMSVGIANGIALIFSFFILITIYKLRISLNVNISLLKPIAKYSFGNYIASFTSNLPLMVMPIIITNNISPSHSGFFYIDMMIINLLLIIPSAASQSLLAEGSHEEQNFRHYLQRTVILTVLFLVPIIVLIILFGNYILLVFGKSFSVEGYTLLRLFALSTIFTSINILLNVVLNIQKRINTIIFISFIGPLILIILTYTFISQGLIGIGIAWLIGEAIISLLYLILVFKRHK